MHDILDTNVLLRFFVGDNEKQQQQAVRWFGEGQSGKRKITVPAIVIAEVCFVLESFYKQPRNKIADTLEVFLSQRWLRVEDRGVLLKLWDWYRDGFHFVDSFLLARALVHGDRILTFDKQIRKKR